MRPVDGALVKRVQRNEPGAMDELIRATYTDAFQLASRMLGHQEDAKDATQEVFIRVVKGVDAFRAESSCPTWRHSAPVTV